MLVVASVGGESDNIHPCVGTISTPAGDMLLVCGVGGESDTWWCDTMCPQYRRITLSLHSGQHGNITIPRAVPKLSKAGRKIAKPVAESDNL